MASSKSDANRRAGVRDTRRLSTSPVAMPRTPPAGFWGPSSAQGPARPTLPTGQPQRLAGTPCAAAAPRRVLLKASGGRRAGSVKATSAAALPGASSAAVRGFPACQDIRDGPGPARRPRSAGRCKQRAPPARQEVGDSLLQAHLSHCPCIRAARKQQAGAARADCQKPRDAAQGRHRRCKLLSQIDIVQPNPRRFGHRRSRRPRRRPEQGIAVGLARRRRRRSGSTRAHNGVVGLCALILRDRHARPVGSRRGRGPAWGLRGRLGRGRAGAQAWDRLRCVRRRWHGG